MKLAKIETFKDLLEFDSNDLYEKIEISASIANIFISSNKCKYNSFKPGMVLKVTNCDITTNNIALSLYVKLIRIDNFEFIEKITEDNRIHYIFRYMKSPFNSINVNSHWGAEDRNQPLRYLIADRINSFLIKLRIQKLIKKILISS